MTLIENRALVLFQGDSITDSGRRRKDPNDLGQGFAWLAAAWFSALYPEKEVSFLNRGISGECTRDLLSRWKRDCLDLKPTWVSILVGINDTWRRYQNRLITTPELFEASYRAMLSQVHRTLGARLIVCEPFVLPYPNDRSLWREDLDPKIIILRRLAAEFEAVYVPLDEIFKEAASRYPAAYWLPDGVHPSPAGHALIAQAWLRAIQAID